MHLCNQVFIEMFYIIWIFFTKNKQGTLHLDLLKAHRAQGWTPQLRSRWHRWHRWQGRPRWQTQRGPHKAWGGGAYPTQEVEHGKAVFSNPERPKKKRKCGGVKLFLPKRGTSKELTKQKLKMNLRDYGQKLRCLRVCCFVVKFEKICCWMIHFQSKHGLFWTKTNVIQFLQVVFVISPWFHFQQLKTWCHIWIQKHSWVRAA